MLCCSIYKNKHAKSISTPGGPVVISLSYNVAILYGTCQVSQQAAGRSNGHRLHMIPFLTSRFFHRVNRTSRTRILQKAWIMTKLRGSAIPRLAIFMYEPDPQPDRYNARRDVSRHSGLLFENKNLILS